MKMESTANIWILAALLFLCFVPSTASAEDLTDQQDQAWSACLAELTEQLENPGVNVKMPFPNTDDISCSGKRCTIESEVTYRDRDSQKPFECVASGSKVVEFSFD